MRWLARRASPATLGERVLGRPAGVAAWPTAALILTLLVWSSAFSSGVAPNDEEPHMTACNESRSSVDVYPGVSVACAGQASCPPWWDGDCRFLVRLDVSGADGVVYGEGPADASCGPSEGKCHATRWLDVAAGTGGDWVCSGSNSRGWIVHMQCSGELRR